MYNFAQNGKVKEMLNALKYFEGGINSDTDPNNVVASKAQFTWGDVDRSALGGCFIIICGLVKDILMQEPRLLEVESPTYILGEVYSYKILLNITED